MARSPPLAPPRGEEFAANLMFLLLFIAAAVAGALNSVAGGGSFLTLPALLFAGVPPIVANATSTVVMWPGSLSSLIAYRRELTATPKAWLVLLSVVGLVGGFVGAVLLVRTSDTSFMRLLPWLMLVAAVTFTFGGHVRRVLASPDAPHAGMLIVSALQFILSIYGGYFGGGMGIMMLASFSLAGMVHIHQMNALKTLLGVATNGLALLTFVVSGAVEWRFAWVMIAGSMLGGYCGAALARTVDPKWVRFLVVCIGWAMTIYFFLR
jgi:uncharacterized membrane protein YfcA